MSRHAWNQTGALLVAVSAIVGLFLSIHEYFTPLTGINGSFGALLVCASSLALALDGFCLGYVKGRGLRALWLVLGFMGALGTLTAGFFLHVPALMGLMVIVLIGLVINLAAPPRRTSVLQG